MTWTVRKIIALVLAIAAPIVAIIGLAVDAENLAFLWCIPVAIASYLFLGGFSALGSILRFFQLLCSSDTQKLRYRKQT